ncbi:MAG: rhodanese-like domain-containing protein [Pseudomonadales bacterium]
MKKSFVLKCLLLPVLWFSFAMFTSAAETVWIDTRSRAENMIDNIEGDHLIAHDSIVAGVTELELSKNTEIKLYCRSGGRAGVAAQALIDAGYTQVENVGGIQEARKRRGIK